MTPVCVLIGPPGSGKSTVGQALAERLGVEFRDTDTDVEKLAGKPISDIFVDDGERRFRDLEADAVIQAVAECAGVVALGGGAILVEETRRELAGHQVVYLSVDLNEAVKRVGLDTGRPLVAVNPRAALRHLMNQRRPYYDQLAVLTVATEGRAVEQVVEEIIAGLAAYGGPVVPDRPKESNR